MISASARSSLLHHRACRRATDDVCPLEAQVTPTLTSLGEIGYEGYLLLRTAPEDPLSGARCRRHASEGGMKQLKALIELERLDSSSSKAPPC